MLVSLGLPTHHVDDAEEWCSAEAIVAMARAAELAQVDAVYVTDHPVPNERFITNAGHHSLDPFVALTVAATATESVRLHTNLVILAYRNPFLSAKALATLDVVSGGRVIVGTGAGYLKPEFAALGVDFDERNDLTDEAIAAMRAVWSGEPVTMSGAHFEAVDSVARPLPVQQPGPPVWIGGNSNRAMRRAVDLADGWNPMPSPKQASRLLRTPPIETVDDLAGRIVDLRRYEEQVGRAEPVDVVFTPIGVDMFRNERPDVEPFVHHLGELAGVGVTGVTINLPGDTRGEWVDNVGWLGEEVLPALR